MRYTLFDTPLGDLLLASDNNALVGVWFADTERPETGEWQRDNGAFGEVTAQLRAYFAGELTEFSLELAPRGTPFQHRVWDALQRIPYGTTTTYGKLAEGLGDPRATRAVGLANGRTGCWHTKAGRYPWPEPHAQRRRDLRDHGLGAGA